MFFGHDGLDELTTTTTSTVFELLDGTVECRELDPSMLGIARADHGALAGGDAAGNAADRASGPRRAATARSVTSWCSTPRPRSSWPSSPSDLAAGIELAGASIDDGKAAAALEALVRTSVAAREDGA